MALILTPRTLTALGENAPAAGDIPTWDGSGWKFDPSNLASNTWLDVGHNADGSNIGTARVFNVKDDAYGAKGDGVADDTTKIQAAITACLAAGGGIVFLPAGTYKVTGSLVFNASSGSLAAFQFAGTGNGSVLAPTAAVTNLFTSNGYPLTELRGCRFSDFKVQYAAQATAGAVFDLPWADRVWVERVNAFNCYHGFTIGQTGQNSAPTINEVWIDKCDFYLIDGSALNFAGGGGNVYITNSYFYGTKGSGTGASKCLSWNSAYYDVIWLDGLDFENFDLGMDFLAISSNTLQAGLADAFIGRVIIDNVGGYGIRFAATKSGTQAAEFSRIKLRDCWVTCSTAAIACQIVASTGGICEDISDIGSNWSGGGGLSTGISVSGNGSGGSIVADIAFDRSQVYTSDTAISLNGCARFSFRGGDLGLTVYGGGTTALAFTDTNTAAMIEHNRLASYSTAISGTPTSGAIRDNRNLNPVGLLAAPPAVPLSGVGVTNPYIYDATVYLDAGAATGVSFTITGFTGASPSISVATGAVVAVLLPVGATIAVTYTGGPPTWTWVGN